MPKVINKLKQRAFVNAERQLLADCRLTPYAKILYLVLQSLSECCENVFPSYKWLARETGYSLTHDNGEPKSERSVFKYISGYISELSTHNLINQVPQSDKQGFDYEVFQYEPASDQDEQGTEPTGSYPPEPTGSYPLNLQVHTPPEPVGSSINKIFFNSKTEDEREGDENFSDEKILAQKIKKDEDEKINSKSDIKIPVDRKVTDFMSKPLFLSYRSKYGEGLSDEHIKEILMLIADKHRSNNQHYNQISDSEFKNWCKGELADLAKEKAKANPQTSYKSNYQSTPQANPNTSNDNGFYRQANQSTIKEENPMDYESKADWDKFVSAQRQLRVSVVASDLDMGSALSKWRSNNIDIESNNIKRHFNKTQSEDSSVSKYDYLDVPIESLETDSEQFLFTANN